MFFVFVICFFIAMTPTKEEEDDDDETGQSGNNQCSLPIGQLANTDDTDWCSRPAQISSERMASIGAAQSRWTDLGG